MAAPRPVQACGGTFCDNGPNAMPVPQTGESILFVKGDGVVEAHIQIQYDADGQAEEFAWVVPVMAQPELSVGSQSLFDALATNTAPTYGTSTWFEPCGGGSGGWDPDPCGDDDGGGGSVKLDAGAGPSDPGEPEVVDHQLVGAFEMFVLDGGTPEGVMTWLGDNGFAQDPVAEPILGEYLADGFMFVAFKLAPSAEASEIHPVVLRYEGDEPCVPLRLTAIAAVDDMVIRTYFLADERMAPTNFKHVELNPLKLDYLGLGANYGEVVSMAVDEAGGQAWVTEFAGSSEIVPPESIPEASWPIALMLGATGFETVRAIVENGWVVCDGLECTWQNPLLEGLLLEHLSLPEGLDPTDVWHCPDCYIEELEAPFDSVAFVNAVEERIIDPARYAVELIATWPTLTRMVTTLSPHEMTVDPLFHEQPDLPDLDLTNEIGTINSFCDGARSFNMPDGRLVGLPGADWPEIEPDVMPWATVIADVPPVGAPQVLTDNTELIDELLSRFNEDSEARAPVGMQCGGTGDDGVWSEDGGIGPIDDWPGPGQDRDDVRSGCGCTSANGAPATLVLVLLSLGLARRRE